MGAMFLMGSTANIDTGKTHGKWHTYCASRFFILTVFAQIYMTVLYFIVWSKIGIVSKANTYFKGILVAMMLVQLYISVKYGVVDFLEEGGEGGDYGTVIGKILEWTLTITVIAGFYSMGLDVDKFEFVYEETSSRE